MKFKNNVAISSLCIILGTQFLRSQDSSPYFKSSDLMNIGVYYYPEAWPESQWARDIANIKKLDLEFVHMGEFAGRSWNLMKASLTWIG